MKIYHNPRCSKSRCSLQILDEKGIDYELIKYLDTPPSRAELKEIITKLGLNPEALVRKGEKIFKEQFKGKSFTDEEWITILTENPILIERPIIVEGDKAVIGRPPEKVLTLLPTNS